MNIIDANCVTHIFESQLDFTNTYFLVPDVAEELELYQAQYHQRLQEKIISISAHPFFDEGIYIDFYRQMLNKHEGKSFFNMTGFGDISILAAIHTVLHLASSQTQKELFEFSKILVFTEDGRLSKRISREFSNYSVSRRLFKDII